MDATVIMNMSKVLCVNVKELKVNIFCIQVTFCGYVYKFTSTAHHSITQTSHLQQQTFTDSQFPRLEAKDQEASMTGPDKRYLHILFEAILWHCLLTFLSSTYIMVSLLLLL